MSKIFSTCSLDIKMLTAFILSYIFGTLVIWDELNQEIGIRRILTTIIIAVVIDITLFAFKKSYNNSKNFRIITGLIFLITYIVLGLTFQNYIFHFMFFMSAALALVIASFFLDLGKL